MTSKSIMQQIEHVVLLMLENRSLDNLLGWLYEAGAPARVVPAGSSASFDGVAGRDLFNMYKSTKLPVLRGTERCAQPLRVPRLDPNEPYDNVTVQLFANGDGKMPESIVPGTPAPMRGFAYDFDAVYESWAELGEVMGAYGPSQLPALSGLARSYAVSDRWFSSVPTQTNPNRAFSLCGTSLGRTVNGPLAVERFDTDTLWNALPSSVSWGLYYHDIWKNNCCFTEYTFPRVDKARAAAKNAEIGRIDKFYERAKAGKLPAFTYLEPAWGYGKGTSKSFIGKQGNDYHPPTWVGPGEVFVNAVYEALIGNPQAWEKTLLIITFDEHGGTYDHVDPGWGAVQPDEYKGPDGFLFNRYGVRVPTIMASPWVAPATVFRAPACSPHPYDHTSLIASILSWQGVDPARAGLGNRVAVAPTFESVLSDTARQDVPRFSVPESYAQQGGGVADFAEAKGLPLGVVKGVVAESASVEATEAQLLSIRSDKEAGAKEQ